MRRILVLFLSAMMVVSLLAACGGSSTPAPTATGTEAAATSTSETENTTPSATETATATATATEEASSASSGSGEVTDITTKAAAAFKDVKTAHFEMVIEGQVGEEASSVTASGDMLLPDRTHMTMDMMGMKLEVITIGTDSYINMGEGWTKSDPSAATTGSTDPNEMINDMDFPNTGKKLADENVDGTDCYHIQYNADDLAKDGDGEAFGDVVMDIYIAKDTNLLKKMVMVPTITGEDEAGSATVTMSFSKYNEPVSIEAPI